MVQPDKAAVRDRLRSSSEQLILQLSRQYCWTVTIGISGEVKEWADLKKMRMSRPQALQE
ncbi:hypothetical protein ACFSQ7_20330 [Paenibacillus rhizoplanae]